MSGRETALEAAKIKKCEWGGCLCCEAGSEMRVQEVTAISTSMDVTSPGLFLILFEDSALTNNSCTTMS